jgi:hypothetical protein
MLKTENVKNGRRATSAFFRRFKIKRTRRSEFDYFFEHGQLWIGHQFSGASWSVVDAEGGPSVNGFDFEQIDTGDESYLSTGYTE